MYKATIEQGIVRVELICDECGATHVWRTRIGIGSAEAEARKLGWSAGRYHKCPVCAAKRQTAEEKAAYNRAWRAEHRDDVREYQRRYQQARRERLKHGK